MTVSNFTELPAVERLKEILLSQAALDIIINDEDDAWLRVTNYYKNYSEGLDMVKIDNGAGDHMYILFSKNGAIIKGFEHESVLSPYANDEEKIAEGIYDYVPNELMELLDVSIEPDDVTFCLWNSQTDSLWKKGKVIVPEDYEEGDDGESFLLGFLFENEDSWLDWARDYYEDQVDLMELDFVKKVYAHQNITKEIIEQVNPNRDADSALEELKEIGYIR